MEISRISPPSLLNLFSPFPYVSSASALCGSFFSKTPSPSLTRSLYKAKGFQEQMAHLLSPLFFFDLFFFFACQPPPRRHRHAPPPTITPSHQLIYFEHESDLGSRLSSHLSLPASPCSLPPVRYWEITIVPLQNFVGPLARTTTSFLTPLEHISISNLHPSSLRTRQSVSPQHRPRSPFFPPNFQLNYLSATSGDPLLASPPQWGARFRRLT